VKTPSEQLRDSLGDRLLQIVAEEEELSPAMVSAMVNFLKQFPPREQLEDLPTAQRISESLKEFKNVMPFDTKVTIS
tara:strand:+ start:4077 stop:4307 length:231 start_codon:yes stop_codon:yes gene_type:complete